MSEAMSPEEVMLMLNRCSGTLFAPFMTDMAKHIMCDKVSVNKKCCERCADCLCAEYVNLHNNNIGYEHRCLVSEVSGCLGVSLSKA